MTPLSLENPVYVERTMSQWCQCLPRRIGVIEFSGTGDPAFCGSANDRPLGIDGFILERGSNAPRAEFETIEQVHEADNAIKNRRPNSILGVLPSWRWVPVAVLPPRVRAGLSRADSMRRLRKAEFFRSGNR